MLSVGTEGDERRTLGLGLRYRGGGEMEENELEEGEAISSLEYDAIVDPDVSLSYIVRLLAASLIDCLFLFVIIPDIFRILFNS